MTSKSNHDIISLIALDLSDGLLTCQICQRSFQAQHRLPRILPCYHSFCADCIQKMTVTAEGKLSCQLCRRQFSVDGEFPVDTTRAALLDLIHSSTKTKKLTCSHFLSCSNALSAKFNCQDCAEIFCDACYNAYHRTGQMKNHRVVPIGVTVNSVIMMVPNTEKCEHHSDKYLEFYCRNCEQVACSSCLLLLLHNGHTLSKLDEVVTDCRQQVEQVCEDFDNVLQSCQLRVQSAERNLKTLNANHRETIGRVEAQFSSYVTILLEKKARVLETLATRVEADRVVFEDQLTQAKSLLAVTKAASDLGRKVAALGLPSHVLQEKKKIKTAYMDLMRQNRALLKSAPVYKVNTSGLDSLTSAVERLGSIYEAFQLDASRCGPECSIDADTCSLINHPPDQDHFDGKQQTFKFRGTCSVAPMSTSSCFWQVRCMAQPNPSMKNDKALCEVGVATEEALEMYDGKTVIGMTSQHCVTALVGINTNKLSTHILHHKRVISKWSMATHSLTDPVDYTFGFFLDNSGRLHVVDINNRRELACLETDPSLSLWPVLNVASIETCGADVKLQVQIQQDIVMTGEVAKLLKSLQEKEDEQIIEKIENIKTEPEEQTADQN